MWERKVGPTSESRGKAFQPAEESERLRTASDEAIRREGVPVWLEYAFVRFNLSATREGDGRAETATLTWDLFWESSWESQRAVVPFGRRREHCQTKTGGRSHVDSGTSGSKEREASTTMSLKLESKREREEENRIVGGVRRAVSSADTEAKVTLPLRSRAVTLYWHPAGSKFG